MDTSDPDIMFDGMGVCNHVHDFERFVSPNWHANDHGNHLLLRKVELIKKNGRGKDFDCILGLSGGLDSSFMLHEMVTKYDLRPLVFHVDGGWNSESAAHNINALVDKLGLELFTEVINWEEMKDFQLAFLKSGVPHIDTPQDHAFIAVLYKYARDFQINTILNGGNIASECVKTPLKFFYWGTDMLQIKDITSRFGSVELSSFPFSSVFYHKLYLRYLRGVDVFKPLNFMTFIKKEAEKILEKEYGWRPFPQKHFESEFTKFFEGYWLPKRFGFDVRRVQFSSLILTSQMSRNDALEKLSSPSMSAVEVERVLEYVSAKLGIKVGDLKDMENSEPKFYYDYRNLSLIFSFSERLLSILGPARRGGAF